MATIDSLVEATIVGDNDLLLIDQGGEGKKLKKGNLKIDADNVLDANGGSVQDFIDASAIMLSTYKTNSNTWDDAVVAAIDKACPAWVTYSDPELLSSASLVAKKIIFPPAKIELTESIPLRSGMHFELTPMTCIQFRPTSPKDLFVVVESEIESGLVIQPDSWITATCNKPIISGGVIEGDLSSDGTGNALAALRLGNVRWGHFHDVTIQRFKEGIWLAPYTLPTSGRIGNFYECMFENVNVTDCITHVNNANNVTTWLGGTIGQVINLADEIKPDHFVKNTGTGLTWLGSNPAPISSAVRPKRALFFDKCAGSTYGGGYHEYNGTIFELDPISRFGGFTFTPSHVFLLATTKDKIIRFKEGSMPYYDYATESVYDPDINGPSNHNELINLGFSIGSPSFIGDALKLPHYDFKYGLLGCRKEITNVIEYDVRGHEDRNNGFVSREAIRITPFKANPSKFSVEIQNPRMMLNICVWYRDIYSNFNPSVGFTVADTNKAVVGQDYIDFGNGYRAAVLRLPTTMSKNTRRMEISVSNGQCIEIENISAYHGGLPIFPSTQGFIPSANVDTGMCDISNSFYNVTSGGLFRAGDIVYPASTFTTAGVWQSATPMVVKTDSVMDVTYGGHGEEYENIAAVNVSANNGEVVIPTSHSHVVIVGAALRLGGAQYKAIKRPFDVTTGKFKSSVLTNSTLTAPSISLDQNNLPAVGKTIL